MKLDGLFLVVIFGVGILVELCEVFLSVEEELIGGVSFCVIFFVDVCDIGVFL